MKTHKIYGAILCRKRAIQNLYEKNPDKKFYKVKDPEVYIDKVSASEDVIILAVDDTVFEEMGPVIGATDS